MGVTEDLRTLKLRKDYKAVVDLMYNTKDAEAVDGFIRDLTRPVDVNGVKRLSNMDLEDLVGIWKEMNKMNCQIILEKGRSIDEWEQKIIRGEVEGAELIVEDPKLRRQVAHDIVIVREGDMINAAFNFTGLIKRETMNVKIGGQSVQEYLESMVHGIINEFAAQNGMNSAEYMDYQNEAGDLNTKENSIDFKVKSGELKPGEMLFGQLPAEIMRIRNCKTEEDLVAYEKSVEDTVKKKEKFLKEMTDSVEKAKTLLAEYTKLADEDLETDYDDVLVALEAYTHLGKDYRYINKDIGLDMITKGIDSMNSSKAISDIEETLKDIPGADSLKAFVKEVKEGPLNSGIKNPSTKAEKKILRMINVERRRRKMENDDFNYRVNDILENHKSPFNLQNFYNFVTFLQNIKDFYPEKADVIDDLAGRMADKMVELQSNPNKKTVKNAFGSTENVDFIIDEKDKRDIVGLIVETDKLMKSLKGYEENSVPDRILKEFDRQLKLYCSEDHELLLKSDSYFTDGFTSTFLTFPLPTFATGKKDKGNLPKFKEDMKRYEAMLKRIPFLDQLEARSNFAVNTLLPFEKNRAGGSVSEQDVESFNRKYQAYLAQEKKYFDTIKSISDKDKDIVENSVFVKNTVKQGFVGNWQEARFADAVLERNAFFRTMISKGWPVSDVNLLYDVKRVMKNMEQAKNNTFFSEEERARIAELEIKANEAFSKAEASYAHSPEVRKELLEGLREPVMAFVDLKYENEIERRKNLPTDEIKVLGKDSISELFDHAFARELNDFEVGNSPVALEMENGAPKAYGFDWNTIRNAVDQMVEDLEAVDPSWMRSSEKFRDMKTALLDLQKYTRNPYFGLMHDDPLQEHEVSMREFEKRLAEVRKYNEAYLNYKGEQFEKDAGRRDSSRKQKREQPRIRMALKMHSALSFMETKAGEIVNQEISLDPRTIEGKNRAKEIMKDVRKIIDGRLAEEEKKLADPKISKSDYLRSICTCLALYQTSKPSFFEKIFDSSKNLDEYKNTVEGIAKMKYSDKELKAVGSVYGIERVMRSEEKNFGQPGHKRLTVEEIKKVYDKTLKSTMNHKTAEQKIRENLHKEHMKHQQNEREYRNKLVSQPKK